MSYHIFQWLCFAPWMIILGLVTDFDNIRATLCIVFRRFMLFFCIFVFFVHADLLQLYLYGVQWRSKGGTGHRGLREEPLGGRHFSD